MKRRYKKAASGLQDVSVPEQGSYSNVASSTASFAAAGSQFGPYGALAGAAIGLGSGLLQKDKQDSANRQALAINRDRKINRSYSGKEVTEDQGMQRFKKGGKVSTKTIEIEGKNTPEIHTDKNFNVKNLGTIPHSKGGNKVEAEEGDIVFNTQNSLSKYNKIAKAIKDRDTTTLTKEKNKLPEDGDDSVNQEGNGGIGLSSKRSYKPYTRAKGVDPGYRVRTKPNTSSKRPQSTEPNYQSMKYGDTNFKSMTYPNLTDSKQESFNDGYKLPNTKANTSISKPNTSLPINGKATKKAIPVSNILPTSNPLSSVKFNPGNSQEADLSPLTNSRSLNQVAESAKPFTNSSVSNSANPNSVPSTVGKSQANNSSGKLANGLNTGLQLAGVANNLFQGLKNEKGVDEKYYDPSLLKYNDRSSSLRNQSNQVVNVQNSNARNLSGGLVSNLRANQNAARIANLDRQGSIDEREQDRADNIANANTEISNQAKQINLGRKDQYDQLNYANRAAKQAYVDQAASDLGQLGMANKEEQYMRSRDDKAYASQTAGLKAINSITPNFSIDEDGNRTFKSRYSKGTKAIKMSKYKTIKK